MNIVQQDICDMELTDEQKKMLKSKVMGNGMTAWEYIEAQNETDRPWVIAGAKSCIEKGGNQ